MGHVSVMTSSGKSAQSGSGRTVPPEFAGGPRPARAAHHGPRALPTLTQNNPRGVTPRGESSGVQTSCETWKGSQGRLRAVAQALSRHRLTTQLMTLESNPISRLYHFTVSYSGQSATRKTGLVANLLVAYFQPPPATRRNTHHSLELRMLDAVPVAYDEALGPRAICSQGRSSAPRSREHRLATSTTGCTQRRRGSWRPSPPTGSRSSTWNAGGSGQRRAPHTSRDDGPHQGHRGAAKLDSNGLLETGDMRAAADPYSRIGITT